MFKHPTDQTVQTGPFGAQLHSDDYVDEGVPFILIRNITQGGVDDRDMPRITQKDANRLSNYSLKQNDIVFSRVGRVGSCFLVEPHHVGWVISGQLLRLRLDFTNLDPRFLVHWIRSHYIERHIGNESVGSTRQSINSTILGRMPVPDVPVHDQRYIAKILDTLDTAIHETEAIIAKLKAIKQGLLHDLLTRGIDANGELRPPQAEAPHLYKLSPLGWIPKEWEEATLGDIAKRSGGLLQTGPFGSQLHAHEYAIEGVPVVMPQDMADSELSVDNIARITERKANALARHRVKPNDLVLSRRGDLSRCVAIDNQHTGWLCGTGCLLARLPNSEVNGYWLALVYQQPITQSQVIGRAVGSTMANLNTSILAAISIARPPIEEQDETAKRLRSASSRIRGEEQALEKMRFEKSGLMDDLLTGRVRVTPLLAQAEQQVRSA